MHVIYMVLHAAAIKYLSPKLLIDMAHALETRGLSECALQLVLACCTQPDWCAALHTSVQC